MTPDKMVAAVLGGSSVTRRAAAVAFAEHHRSTTAPDIIAAIGKAFDALYDHPSGVGTPASDL